jgi:hypothetical protein
MDQDDIKTLYDDKYKKILGLSYEEWTEQGPQSEAEAYARLQEIDDELKAEGDRKNELEEYRDKLKAEYDFLEAAFGLEAPDKNW